jgi:hypothetical protein
MGEIFLILSKPLQEIKYYLQLQILMTNAMFLEYKTCSSSPAGTGKNGGDGRGAR